MIFQILNVVLMVVFWKWADENFEEGRNYVGWLYIAASAMNGASVAATIF